MDQDQQTEIERRPIVRQGGFVPVKHCLRICITSLTRQIGSSFVVLVVDAPQF